MTTLKTYPVPALIKASEYYAVSANGIQQFVYETRVSAMPVNQVFRGRNRPLHETELAGYTLFAADGPVEMTVSASFEIFMAQVRPTSKNVKVSVDTATDTMTFTLPGPGFYTLEPNGPHHALHIFIDPIEEDRPDPNDPNVIYFAPGKVYNRGIMEIKSNQTVFIDAGAYVYGMIDAENAENIRICGHGVLDGSLIPRAYTPKGGRGIGPRKCRNVIIEGITITDTAGFAIAPSNCENVRIENVKVIGLWRYNSDGIHPCGCNDVLVRNCFVRAFDDSLGASGTNCTFEDCVVWTDWGRSLEANGKHTIFRNIDIIHFLFHACDVQCMGPTTIEDILFEDIRVEEPLDPHCEPRLIEVYLRKQCWCGYTERMGYAHNVRFKNVSYTGRTLLPIRFMGYTAESDAKGIYMENITLNGVKLTEKGHPMVTFIANEFASDIYVDGRPIDYNYVKYSDEEDASKHFLIGNGAYISFTLADDDQEYYKV